MGDLVVLGSHTQGGHLATERTLLAIVRHVQIYLSVVDAGLGAIFDERQPVQHIDPKEGRGITF